MCAPPLFSAPACDRLPRRSSRQVVAGSPRARRAIGPAVDPSYLKIPYVLDHPDVDAYRFIIFDVLGTYVIHPARI